MAPAERSVQSPASIINPAILFPGVNRNRNRAADEAAGAFAKALATAEGLAEGPAAGEDEAGGTALRTPPPDLLPLGLLAEVRIVPSPVRIGCGAAKLVCGHALDAAGRPVDELVSFQWSLDPSREFPSQSSCTNLELPGERTCWTDAGR